ncbi:(S)-citramalyl-CoA lyase [Pseudovibrio ascidiaceicola]|uniref:(S)-citramalyl-CoA lyase n=1 Tax=Pseudovibrio ascidiaceicola TaxID=285279 RepID=A0A1I4D3H5_9HYPH|nr:CoA ester lyase [Pseudovibrio ascidiaceicola]SFK86736.1 (S)-citramalyl-CoA lyase [Pseudovibrio ascidiaceicola]
MKSLLFLPADKAHLFPKATASGAGCVVLDLEDGVCEKQKSAARDLLRGLQDELREHETCEIGVRISSLSTPSGLEDVLCLLELAHLPDWIFLPKCESPRDLEQLDHLLRAHPGKEMVRICALLETPAGLSNAEAIASTHAPLHALAFGYADYTAETGGTMGWNSLVWPRGQLLNAAVQNHLWAIDGVFLDFNDPEGLEDEARNARDMGYNGKFAIHPSQVSVVNSCFEPSDEEVQWALNVLEKQKDTAGQGAFVVDGKMVDAPVILRARRLLGLSDGDDHP